jgi:phage terminase large subunit-like protein
MTETSALDDLASALVDGYAGGAHGVLDELLEGMPRLNLAAALYDWQGVHARPKQLLPEDDDWLSFGLLTGRGFGKTRTLANFVRGEVEAERAWHIALIAQNEDETFNVMVDGPSGLIAQSPPWFRPRWERGRLTWPNGAEAHVYTPEKPGGLRGPEHDLAWASELVVWPRSTRDEALANLLLGLRRGRGRLVWDSTPKRRHPLIRYMLERASHDPATHRIIRGTTLENARNLPPQVLAQWQAEYGGTQRGREELEGEFLDESDGALWKQDWIDDNQRDLPTQFTRRILSVDPARSMREGTDATGMVELGLGVDGQVYVIEDLTKREPPSEYAPKLIRRYIDSRCDCLVAERDSGGNLVAEVLRLRAKERGLTVITLNEKQTTRHVRGVIYVREVNTQQRSKGERAEPVADAYEQGRVSHVVGAELQELEDELCGWEPDGKGPSPNRLDALVHGVRELLNIADKRVDGRAGFAGLAEANKRLQAPARGGNLGGLMVRGGRGGRTI